MESEYFTPLKQMHFSFLFSCCQSDIKKKHAVFSLRLLFFSTWTPLDHNNNNKKNNNKTNNKQWVSLATVTHDGMHKTLKFNSCLKACVNMNVTKWLSGSYLPFKWCKTHKNIQLICSPTSQIITKQIAKALRVIIWLALLYDVTAAQKHWWTAVY